MVELTKDEIAGRLADFLSDRMPHAGGVHVDLAKSGAKAGFSAETILFDAEYRQGQGPILRRPMVMKRQIFGHDLTFDADLRHQWRVMEALKAHTDLPTPALVGLELDHAVLGAPFLVMERLPGRIVPQNPNYNLEGWLKELPLEARSETWLSGIRAMARVHKVDWRQGFEFLYQPERGPAGLPGYVAWIKEWLTWALNGRRHPVAEAAMAWLETEMPADAQIGLLWGDAIPSNQLYDDDGQVSGLIDWEFAALAPGEIDLAWWLYFDDLFSEGYHVPRLEGLPSREAMVAAYEDAAGRPVRSLDYYFALVGLRMTIISIRAVDRLVAQGRFKADNDAWIKNPSSAWLARHLRQPALEVGPDFFEFSNLLFGKH